MRGTRYALLLVLALCGLQAKVHSQTEVERFALYIGANDGGPNRDILRYAATDAQSLASAMHEIGGVSSQNQLILINPDTEQINDALLSIASKMRLVQKQAKRIEFLFYYSGHSSEKGLLLGETEYTYTDLKKELLLVPGDVHIVMLDSCYSGNFMHTSSEDIELSKGGTKQKPFLVDDSTVVTGHAYLSSSSATEQSQESDELKGSYFTNALVTGLRGAADTNGDKKVSLNELYYYAFNYTLSATQKSKSGPQHPGYNVTLVGSGDMIITDIGSAEAVLIIDDDVSGDIVIRNSSGALVSELVKKTNVPISLALPSDTYEATVISHGSISDCYFILAKNKVYTLNTKGLTSIAYQSTNRTRGGTTRAAAEDAAENPASPSSDAGTLPAEGSGQQHDLAAKKEETVAHYAETSPKTGVNTVFKLGLFNQLQFPKIPVYPVCASINVLSGADLGVTGVQLNLVTGFIRGSLNGVQLSGIYGYLQGTIKGVQIAGLWGHTTGTFTGVQFSPVINTASGSLHGLQLGLWNYVDDIYGIQIGIVNIARKVNGISIGLLNFIDNGFKQAGVFFDSDGTLYAQYQSGTSNCYSTLLFGRTLFDCYDTDLYPFVPFVYGVGLGTSKTIGTYTLGFDGILKMRYTDKPLFVPEIRGTISLDITSHIHVCLGAGIDLYEKGINSDSFGADAVISPSFTINGTELALHPAYYAGLTIR